MSAYPVLRRGDLGLDLAGMSALWQIERNRQCNQVLAHHWPTVRLERKTQRGKE